MTFSDLWCLLTVYMCMQSEDPHTSQRTASREWKKLTLGELIEVISNVRCVVLNLCSFSFISPLTLPLSSSTSSLTPPSITPYLFLPPFHTPSLSSPLPPSPSLSLPPSLPSYIPPSLPSLSLSPSLSLPPLTLPPTLPLTLPHSPSHPPSSLHPYIRPSLLPFSLPLPFLPTSLPTSLPPSPSPLYHSRPLSLPVPSFTTPSLPPPPLLYCSLPLPPSLPTETTGADPLLPTGSLCITEEGAQRTPPLPPATRHSGATGRNTYQTYTLPPVRKRENCGHLTQRQLTIILRGHHQIASKRLSIKNVIRFSRKIKLLYNGFGE